MRHMTRWIGAGLVSLAGLGCVAAEFPGQPTAGDLARDLTAEMPRISRAQRGDDAPIMVAQATPPLSIPTPLPSPLPAGASNVPPPVNIAPPPGMPSAGAAKSGPLPNLPASSPTTIAPPPGGASNIPLPPPGGASGGIQPASVKTNRQARVAVRARVNGRPIFDDEVILQLEMTNPAALQRGNIDQITEAYNQTLNSIIELEIAYQDAVKKLEKGNPKALEKLRQEVDKQYDTQVKSIRKAIPDDKFQEIAPTLRRQIERSFIGMEYIRSMIFSKINAVGYLEVKDYYDTHMNEFQKVESVKWQHAFIAVNAQRPTVADAKRFGQKLLSELPPNADFATLAKYDDGDSKTRKGDGFGNRKGDIQPAELEKYLFELKDGQIGPVVEVSTGVHLFRLIQRDVGGQVPLNDVVQSQIRTKIKNQIFEREFKRLVKELKTRAVVAIDPGP